LFCHSGAGRNPSTLKNTRTVKSAGVLLLPSGIHHSG